MIRAHWGWTNSGAMSLIKGLINYVLKDTHAELRAAVIGFEERREREMAQAGLTFNRQRRRIRQPLVQHLRFSCSLNQNRALNGHGIVAY